MKKKKIIELINEQPDILDNETLDFIKKKIPNYNMAVLTDEESETNEEE